MARIDVFGKSAMTADIPHETFEVNGDVDGAMDAEMDGTCRRPARPCRERLFAGLARRTAALLLVVAVVFAFSIAGRVVEAIDGLGDDSAVTTFSLDGPTEAEARFETSASGGDPDPGDPDSSDAEHGEPEHPAANSDAPLFVEVPDMLVSLDAGQGRSVYVKVAFSLELPDHGDKTKIQNLMPRIVDQCQVYLRELRRDDFKGSSGVLRVREELLRRVSHAVAPIQVDDVLLTGLIVQ